MQIERELKFRLPARSASRVWNLLPGTSAVRRRSVESVYYDTPDRRLRSARAALRLRHDGRRWLMCFKSERGPATGLAQRSEWEVPAARAAFAPGALPLEAIAQATRIDLRRMIPRLAPVFTTRFIRQSVEIALPGGAVAELCVDVGRVVAGRRAAPIRELELELRAGDLAAMLKFAEGLIAPLGLQLEPLSKAERGYRLVAAERPTPIKAQQSVLRNDEPVAAAMEAVVRACLAQIEANARGVAEDRDPEYLHQLRVGMRRLRSALRTFNGLGQRKDFRAPAAGLKELMPILGRARDWDVFCAGLERRAQADEAALLLRRARARRADARREARALVGSARLQHFLLGVLRWMDETPWRGGRKAARPVAEYARRALARLERKLVRLGEGLDWADAARRHRLRIRAKRLRYACEPFAALYPGGAMGRYLDGLESLQDILGELNDIAVGRRLLRALRLGRGDAGAAVTRRGFAAREKRLVGRLAAAWRAWRQAMHPW